MAAFTLGLARFVAVAGNYEDSLLCYTESLQWTEGLCGAAEQTRALLAAAALMSDLGRHTALAAEAAEAAEAAKAAAAATPSNRKGGTVSATAVAAATQGSEPGTPSVLHTERSTGANGSSGNLSRSWRPLRSLMSSNRRNLSLVEIRGLRYCRFALESALLLSPGHPAAAARLIKVLLLQGDFPAAAKALQHVLQHQLNSATQTPRKILWLRGLLQGDAAAASAAAKFLANAQSLTDKQNSSNNSTSVDVAAEAAAHDNDLAAQFLKQQQGRVKRQLAALKAEGEQSSVLLLLELLLFRCLTSECAFAAGVYACGTDTAAIEALRGGASASSRPLLLPLPLKATVSEVTAATDSKASAPGAAGFAADGSSQVALVLDALRLAFLQGISDGNIR